MYGPPSSMFPPKFPSYGIHYSSFHKSENIEGFSKLSNNIEILENCSPPAIQQPLGGIH